LDGLCILVVEDVEDSLEAMRLTLERLGADVLTARDGVEALETVTAEHADRWSAISNCPAGRIQFLQALRMRKGTPTGPSSPFLACQQRDHQRIRVAGFAGHIDKPFDDVRLLAAIDDARSPILDCLTRTTSETTAGVSYN
jgi:CheY-like chemotaxis protein